MISVICVYNNQNLFEKYLLKSLKQQKTDYELISINNIHRRFESAPKALNYGASKAKGKYLMFVHQDIDLCSELSLKNMTETLDSLENLGIAGVAGVSENQTEIISNSKHGNPPLHIGKQFNSPFSVQTLDECLIIIPRIVFEKFKFDEKLNGWHLYSVDYCLTVKKQGYNVYVIPQFIYHESPGSANSKDYFSILKIVLEKYKTDYSEIHTTVGLWYTRRPLIIQEIFYYLKVWVSITLYKLKNYYK